MGGERVARAARHLAGEADRPRSRGDGPCRSHLGDVVELALGQPRAKSGAGHRPAGRRARRARCTFGVRVQIDDVDPHPRARGEAGRESVARVRSRRHGNPAANTRIVHVDTVDRPAPFVVGGVVRDPEAKKCQARPTTFGSRIAMAGRQQSLRNSQALPGSRGSERLVLARPPLGPQTLRARHQRRDCGDRYPSIAQPCQPGQLEALSGPVLAEHRARLRK